MSTTVLAAPAWVALSVFALACTAPQPGGGGATTAASPSPVPPPSTTTGGAGSSTTATQQVDLCGGDPACTNLWALAHHWTLDPSFSSIAAVTLGDLDGDGEADALVALQDAAEVNSSRRYFVVSGPLDRDVHLPADASGELGGADADNVILAGDATGDGQVDIVEYLSEEYAAEVVAGPLSGSVDLDALAAAVTGLPYDTSFLDLDGDGVVEAISYLHSDEGASSRYEVYGGPVHTGDPPVLTINPTCDDQAAEGDAWDAIYQGPNMAITDVDGDGVRDLPFVTFWGENCPWLTVSGAARGVVTESSPGVYADQIGVAIGDTTGDGVSEVLEVGAPEFELVVGPMSGSPVQAAAAVPPVLPWTWVLPSGHLLTAGTTDGRGATVFAGAADATEVSTFPAWGWYFPDAAPNTLLLQDGTGFAIATVE